MVELLNLVVPAIMVTCMLGHLLQQIDRSIIVALANDN
jgi:hypothetical protein